MSWAPRSAAGTFARDPLNLPTAVRSAAVMTTSFMYDSSVQVPEFTQPPLSNSFHKCLNSGPRGRVANRLERPNPRRRAALVFETRRHPLEGGLYLSPGFIHVSFEFRPIALGSAFQLVEVLPCLRLRSAQFLELFIILGLAVRLDLVSAGFEAFGLRLPLVQLFFHLRLIIFPRFHNLCSCCNRFIVRRRNPGPINERTRTSIGDSGPEAA